MEVSCALRECSSPPIEHWRLNLVFLHLSAARNDFEHATCVLRAHRILEPPPRPINACISCRLTNSTSQCHSQCLLMRCWRAFRVVVFVKAMVVMNCSTGPHLSKILPHTVSLKALSKAELYLPSVSSECSLIIINFFANLTEEKEKS